MTICYEQSVHNRGSLTHKIDVLFTYKIRIFHPTTPKVLTHSSMNSKFKVSSKSDMDKIPGLIHPEAKFLSSCEPMKTAS